MGFCDCEPMAITLLRLHLWPGSPERPTTAFHVNLMDVMEKVFLHCKVSLKEFCEAIELLRPSIQPNLVHNVKTIS